VSDHTVPRCRKCGQAHYNFQECRPQHNMGKAAVVVRQPRPGFREWQGDKLRTVKAAHGETTVIRQERRFTAAGRVLAENNKDMKLPRLPKPQPTVTYPEGVNNG